MNYRFKKEKINLSKVVEFQDLGIINYKEAWDYQEELFQTLVSKKCNQADESNANGSDHFLLFCEHKPVITLGKSGEKSNLLLNDQMLNQLGIDFYKINRGGDITFHGPGQLVGYPILNLDYFVHDIHLYMRNLEEVIIQAISEFGLNGERLKGSTGVWLDTESPSKVRKICAMGVRASRWVTMHGWALNVNTDLSFFSHIIPCGISDKAVTSLNQELGEELNMQEIKQIVKEKFQEVFSCQLVSYSS